MFEEIERFVKARYKDAKELKKHASEIASEIAERMEYGRKAAQYALLVSELENEKQKIETAIQKMESAKSIAGNDTVTIKTKNPNIIYIEKKQMLMRKLNDLTDKSIEAKKNIDTCINSAEERRDYYQNKIFG
ncbi:protein esaC [Macrococcus capreoli]|uniref:protein esaC n=1 Tax=Macrococcus capreoli TaxID=2982690 RepID=UPI003EE4A356